MFFTMFLIIFSFICTAFLTTHVNFITRRTFPTTSVIWNEEVSVFTSIFSFIYGSWATPFQRIFLMTYKLKMIWINTSSVITNMVDFFIGEVFPLWNFTSFPSIKKSINPPYLSSKPYSSISIVKFSSPIPTLGDWIDQNIRKDSFRLFFSEHTQIIPQYLRLVNRKEQYGY